ncbi:hypothetical protein CDAR_425691 [Caerostris darwini]|uniref:Uncharacterized protein n=1 Tax=Caerostris darwini TaxID=1538125 RepID=A0AAV4N2T2_9ARAC|nr:hypothetical protein CDAR_425691 [Caerostris darwini]
MEQKQKIANCGQHPVNDHLGLFRCLSTSGPLTIFVHPLLQFMTGGEWAKGLETITGKEITWRFEDDIRSALSTGVPINGFRVHDAGYGFKLLGKCLRWRDVWEEGFCYNYIRF